MVDVCSRVPFQLPRHLFASCRNAFRVPDTTSLSVMGKIKASMLEAGCNTKAWWSTWSAKQFGGGDIADTGGGDSNDS